MVYIYTLLRRNEKLISDRTSIINKYFLEKQGAFFGMTKEAAYESYNDFMTTDPIEAPALDGFFPKGPITDYVDFLSIESGR
jgi:hypothetical protein